MAGSGEGVSAVVLTNLDGYSIGVDQAIDASINVQKVTCKATSQHKDVMDRIGVVIGRADWDFKQSYSIEGYVASTTTGIMAETIGGLVTLAALTSLGGIATGGATLLDEITIEQATGELVKMTATLTYYANIPAGASQQFIAAAP
jgi:hypothetical protein